MTPDIKNDGPLLMDVPDFIPEVYEPRFKIEGRLYAFRYEEATVDEVFRLMAEDYNDKAENIPEHRRRIVTKFLTKHIVEGDPVQLEADLKKLPYSRPGAPIDIERLYQPLLMRVKKNETGESQADRTE